MIWTEIVEEDASDKPKRCCKSATSKITMKGKHTNSSGVLACSSLLNDSETGMNDIVEEYVLLLMRPIDTNNPWRTCRPLQEEDHIFSNGTLPVCEK